MQIHENSKVTLNFALRLENGDTVDSTFDTQPATLCIGDGNLPEGFEKHLMGLAEGDSRTVKVAPEDAFGQVNPGNLQQFKTEQLAQIGSIEVGMMVSFEDAAGTELPGVITEIGDELVTVDFNHPLAGKSLDFEVEIIAVEAATDGH
ncbi:FKBP-type peptidyl-prolyl cis-trans isomerase [Reinekea thalattae]|uniref:Peptidyl-prolyl cis-trans isomerase n=1 Tax=Reinekea thalattae TaxID=2593301 RepID=A0A5C8Z2S6_9GAMM|nr:FKBP-type peptidyl-prolyl cis-trans isomerase [Reinekea thalattae]TXR51513.1 FKBP-type peptidyl-prolyl cis-trans isomerase [Reinekea thalattae]